MSETSEEMKMVHFAVVVEGEVAAVLSMYENSQAAIAGLSSDPKIVVVPEEMADYLRSSTPMSPWTWDGEKFIAPES